MTETRFTPAYGSDPHGLICGYLFEPGRSPRPLLLPEAAEWLESQQADTGSPTSGPFAWLHFDLSNSAAEAGMRSVPTLAPAFFEALREGSRSTRIEDADEHLIAVVNDVAYEFSFDPSEIATLWMAVNPFVVLSARSHPLKSIDRLREAVKRGHRIESPVALLNHLLRDQADVLVRIVREATVQVDEVEDTLQRGQLQRRRAQLGKLRRVLVRLQRLLAPEPGAMFRLLREPPPWIAAHDVEEIRQATEEFSLVLRDLSALQERIRLLQEEIAAQVGEQTNRSLFTLTVITVLGLPINICTGLFGMNVGGIPFADAPHGFAIILVLLAAFTVLAGWIAFRRRE